MAATSTRSAAIHFLPTTMRTSLLKQLTYLKFLISIRVL